MADFSELKQTIDENVNTNGIGAITGAILNMTLKEIIDAVNQMKQDSLEYYHENTNNGKVNILTDSIVDIFGSDKASLRSGGYRIESSGEEGIVLRTNNNNVKLRITNDSFSLDIGEGELTITADLTNGVCIGEEKVAKLDDIPDVYSVLGFKYFSENVAYNIGDIVIYLQLLYRFTSPHTGQWDENDVEPTNLVQILNL